MAKYIIALDLGTTSVRACLYDCNTHQFIQQSKSEIKQYYPAKKYVEQDAEEIFNNIHKCLKDIVKNIEEKDIYGLGITNQRETVTLWQKDTGKPIHNSIVWQDRRTDTECKTLLKDKKLVAKIHKATGLFINSYFSATKIKWMLNRIPVAKDLIESNNLCCGTIESYIIFRLTKGKSFVTDHSNACRTMLYNINTFQWDDFLLKFWGVPHNILPNIVDCDECVGETTIDGKTIKIGGILGDQQASLFGQACLTAGTGKNTYGTGAFMLYNLGEKPIFSKNDLLTTVAWKTKHHINYALEGSMYCAGSCITWLQNQMHFIKKASDSETLAQTVQDNDGVVFVPALTGLGAPFWNSNATGTFTGLTLDTTQAHLVRAVLTGIACNVRAVMDCIISDCGIPLKEFRVDGGMTCNHTFLQIQSNILNAPVLPALEKESTSLGAVFMCGLCFGAFSDFAEISKLYKAKDYLIPQNVALGKQEYREWLQAVKYTKL